MKITGGRLRGRVVRGRVGAGVRPTSSRVREAMFSMVGQDLIGWTVLDAFGGSGLLAFEAASRGADRVTVAERNRGAAKEIERSAKDLGVHLEIRNVDARRIFGSGVWDLVVLDPPYADDPNAWLDAAAVAVRRLLVIEHRTGNDPDERVGALELDRRRIYGDTTLSLYRPRTSSSVGED